MNIQFIETEPVIDRLGHKVYIPDYEKLKENACCEEEKKAIDECRDLFERTGTLGFAFQVVHTHYGKIWDPFMSGKVEYGWTIYQHPWYQRYDENKKCYVKDSKEDIVKEIAVMEVRMS